MKKKLLIIMGILLVIIIPFSLSSVGVFYKPREITILDIIIVIGILFLCYGIYYKIRRNKSK